MKAFRGCTNTDCKAYKKIHFKADDLYCPKCGLTLDYVCADCWKIMENDRDRLCIACKKLREQNKEQRVGKVKAWGAGAAAGVAGVAAVVKNADKLTSNIKVIAKGAGKVINTIRKV